MAEKEVELTSRTDVWHDDVHHGFFFQELCFEGKQEYFVGDGKFVWQDFFKWSRWAINITRQWTNQQVDGREDSVNEMTQELDTQRERERDEF